MNSTPQVSLKQSLSTYSSTIILFENTITNNILPTNTVAVQNSERKRMFEIFASQSFLFLEHLLIKIGCNFRCDALCNVCSDDQCALVQNGTIKFRLHVYVIVPYILPSSHNLRFSLHRTIIQ